MAEYRPSLPFSTPMKLLIPTYSKKQGVRVKTLPTGDIVWDGKSSLSWAECATSIWTEFQNGILIFGTFKTYGGTETTDNGILSIEDTANIETWYRPDIKSDCVIALANSEIQYEIIGEPENINLRNQFLKFKVKRIKGGA